jgi:hypothetical protein
LRQVGTGDHLPAGEVRPQECDRVAAQAEAGAAVVLDHLAAPVIGTSTTGGSTSSGSGWRPRSAATNSGSASSAKPRIAHSA